MLWLDWQDLLSKYFCLPCCWLVCRELSRTHNVCLFIDANAADMQNQAAGVGILQLFIIIEDLTSGHSTTSAVRSSPPFVLGHIVEYRDAAGTLCMDICNHCTLLNPSILSLGKSCNNHVGRGNTSVTA